MAGMDFELSTGETVFFLLKPIAGCPRRSYNVLYCFFTFIRP